MSISIFYCRRIVDIKYYEHGGACGYMCERTSKADIIIIPSYGMKCNKLLWLDDKENVCKLTLNQSSRLAFCIISEDETHRHTTPHRTAPHTYSSSLIYLAYMHM